MIGDNGELKRPVRENRMDYLRGSQDWHDVNWNKMNIVHSDVQFTCDVLGEHLAEPDPNYQERHVAVVAGEDMEASSCLAAVHLKAGLDIDHT